MNAVSVTHRPARASAAAAVAFAFVAVAVLPRTGAVRSTLLMEAGGLFALWAGFALRDRGAAGRLVGSVVAAIGAGAVALSFGLLLVRTHRLSVIVETAPGMLGVFLLALGVLPVRGSGSRGLVKAGAALVFASVLAAGLFQSPIETLLLAGAATVVAWDVGENAISIGEQLGTAAETRPIEAAHTAGSLLAGSAAVFAGTALVGAGTAGVSLARLVLLLFAALALTAALHR